MADFIRSTPDPVAPPEIEAATQGDTPTGGEANPSPESPQAPDPSILDPGVDATLRNMNRAFTQKMTRLSMKERELQQQEQEFQRRLQGMRDLEEFDAILRSNPMLQEKFEEFVSPYLRAQPPTEQVGKSVTDMQHLENIQRVQREVAEIHLDSALEYLREKYEDFNEGAVIERALNLDLIGPDMTGRKLRAVLESVHRDLTYDQRRRQDEAKGQEKMLARAEERRKAALASSAATPQADPGYSIYGRDGKFKGWSAVRSEQAALAREGNLK